MKIDKIKAFEKNNRIELPHDDIVENGVIGTLLVNPEFIFKSSYLKPNMFYNRELACIYHIINTLLEKGIDIDNLTILSEIEDNKHYKQAINDVPEIARNVIEWLDRLKMIAKTTVEDYEFIAKKIVSYSFKREAYVKVSSLGMYILESNEDINKINYKLQTETTKFADTYIIDSNMQTMGEKVDSVWQKIVERRNGDFFGLPSKYTELNKWFTYENGELVIVGGRAKAGKSMFFLNEAIHKVEMGVPSAVFDTEMDDDKWLVRFLALKSGVDIRRVKSGRYSREEEVKIIDAMNWLKNKPLYHIYDPDWTDDKMFMKAKQLKLSSKLGFLVDDYIKVNDTSSLEGKEHNKLGDKTNFLKNTIAGGLDIPVLAGAQMSPKEIRLADSDKINRYASTIAYWIAKTKEEIVEDGEDSGNYKFFIDYNRNGRQMYEDEYINFVFKGDVASIFQAKKPFKCEEENIPY